MVPAHRPETFYQAIQTYWFTHLAVTTELNPWDAYSPGHFDQHLGPFYERDVQAGILTRDQAQELMECLWVKFYNQPAPPKVGITLQDVCLISERPSLHAAGASALPGVLQALAGVHQFLDNRLRVVEGGLSPAFPGNLAGPLQEFPGIFPADLHIGVGLDQLEVIHAVQDDVRHLKVFELTLFNGVDQITGKQLGPKTGEAKDFKTFDQLWDAYTRQIEHFLSVKIQGSNLIEALYAKYMPVPFLSILTNDCIAQGRDYNAGGARYNTSVIQGVGTGTISDCLAAVKYNVYDHQNFTMEELLAALRENFQGHDRILNLVRNKTPKYGNDDDYADGLMRKVFNYFVDSVSGRPNMRGGTYRVDMLPTTCHVYFGDVMIASPNGRLAHKPVSEGISPEKGADVNGPTAVIKSCAKMDHLKTGGTLLNQKFTPAVVAGEEGLDRMADLVRSYFDMDGHHIQFNVVDRDTLRAAQKNPEEYRDLIVRVAGYSDYFRNLDKALQDEIIERTEQGFGV